MRGRIVAIDFGDVRIGLAVSDTSHFLASPHKTVEARKTAKETAQMLLVEFSTFEPIEKIVLGLPLLMSGKESPGSQKVRELAKELEALTEAPIVLWDERLTTSQVERTLKEAEMSRKKRSKHLDTMAAAAILQSYLDSPCNK